MAVFTYRAVDRRSGTVTGEVAADTPRQARERLRAQGLSPELIRQRTSRGQVSFLQRWRIRRRSDEVVGFIRDLSTLLAAGIPLIEALETVADQYTGPFGAAILAMREDIAAGGSLAEAMEANGVFFDKLSVSIAAVGENSGKLETSLARLAEFKEHSLRLRNRVATALIYPGIVATVGVAVTVFLMTFVVPQLLTTLTESGKPLPAVTRCVKAASDFLIGYGWAVLLAAIAAAAGIRALLATPRGRKVWHRLVLRIPLIGELVRKETIARLAVVLATLLRSGVVFLQALVIARNTVRNEVFREELSRCERAVAAGQDIAPALQASGVFPSMMIKMLAVGQQAGELEGMLEQLAAAYEHRVATATQRLTAVLEPVLIIALALLVGFVAFATVLPIMEASHVL